MSIQPREGQLSEETPAWFNAYVHAPYDDYVIEVEGAHIHYKRWQRNTIEPQTGLIFVHGNGAHAHWWDFIAPAFSDKFDIIAVDLSGAGDSNHRDVYTAPLFAQEIMAVAGHAGFKRPVVSEPIHSRLHCQTFGQEN